MTAPGQKYNGIWQRTLSSLVMILTVMGMFYLGFPWLDGFFAVVGVIMAIELALVVKNAQPPRSLWRVMIWLGLGWGVIFAVIFCVHALARQSMLNLIWVLCLISATDIGAYLFGRAIGRSKLAPKISPNKTWEGLLGGIILAAIANLGFCYGLDVGGATTVVLAILISILAQMGDLGESWCKRQFNQKDSGNWIPGHGGILDRVDGLLVVMPVVWILSTLFNAPPLAWQWGAIPGFMPGGSP
ncbi:MAG: phosphatidate cytidylyltransferase [Candidatus Symbiobacter sp.]|nr:phosphatidate cytidylyltransferase [Candidatus Symbiobacter sp.]